MQTNIIGGAAYAVSWYIRTRRENWDAVKIFGYDTWLWAINSYTTLLWEFNVALKWAVTPSRSATLLSNSVLSITIDLVQIQTWKWYQCVRMIMAHRYMCSMTQLDPFGLPRDLYLRSNFQTDLVRSLCICFDSSWRGKHDYVIKKCIPLIV